MADAVTLEQFLGILIVALGGKEGITMLVKKLNNKKRDFVTKEFCAERHRNLERALDTVTEQIETMSERQVEIRSDIKSILSHTQPKGK